MSSYGTLTHKKTIPSVWKVCQAFLWPGYSFNHFTISPFPPWYSAKLDYCCIDLWQFSSLSHTLDQAVTLSWTVFPPYPCQFSSSPHCLFCVCSCECTHAHVYEYLGNQCSGIQLYLYYFMPYMMKFVCVYNYSLPSSFYFGASLLRDSSRYTQSSRSFIIPFLNPLIS